MTKNGKVSGRSKEAQLERYRNRDLPAWLNATECIALLTKHSKHAILQFEQQSNYPEHFVDRLRWICGEINGEYQQNRIRKQEQDLRKGEIQIAIMEGKVIDRELLAEFFGGHVALVRELLDQFEKQMAPFRKLSDPLGQHIDDLFRDFRNELARVCLDEIVKHQRRKSQ